MRLSPVNAVCLSLLLLPAGSVLPVANRIIPEAPSLCHSRVRPLAAHEAATPASASGIGAA